MLLPRGAAALLRGPCRCRPRAWPQASSRTIAAATTSPPPSLPYPRAAVAALALRPAPGGAPGTPPLVLVVQRANPPHAGCWSFPGGSLELGETLVAGAARELWEETGLRFRPASGGDPSPPPPGEVRAGGDRPLSTIGPTPFTASDAIVADPATGGLRFHYAIIQVAGLVQEEEGGGGGGGGPAPVPVAGGDAAGVAWVSLPALAAGEAAAPGGAFTPGCAAVAQEALARYGAELGWAAGVE